MDMLRYPFPSDIWWRPTPEIFYNNLPSMISRQGCGHFRLNTDPDPIRIRIKTGSRALMNKN
jgi:hypothetical protein